MRQTFSQLIQSSQNYCVDDNTSSPSSLSDTKTFIQNEINATVSEIYDLLRDNNTQILPLTSTTVDGQTYYHNPPMTGSIESITITQGNIAYELNCIESQKQWNMLFENTVTSTAIPKYFFPRQHDFGLYPTPNGAYTITMIINSIPYLMDTEDYTSGTIAITNGSRTVTGTDTAFTSTMVNRWLYEETNKVWQRISAYSSTTSLTLETNYINASISGSSYRIGQSPEIPDIFHHMIPFRVGGIYLSTIKRNPNEGQKLLNIFWTGDPNNFKREGKVFGGVLGTLKRIKSRGRGNYQIVDNGIRRTNLFDERWRTTLSE